MIKDRIILNGDVLTFLKLLKEAAKRKIFENYNTDSELEWGKVRNSITLKLDGEVIYYFQKKFNGLLVKDDLEYTEKNIFNSLRDYLNKLKEKGDSDHKPSIEKLNHLRDSIVANMIGVISFLQRKENYPGFVILEDLSKDEIDKHFDNLNVNISRRLEFGLFSKFQTMGLVPPHVKNLIEIRESKRGSEKSYQFGAIVFVDEKGTSTECPYCEERLKRPEEMSKEKWREYRDDLKFSKHRFICEEHKGSECKFDTDDIKYGFLKEINDPDKVASFNVAKKIKDYKEVGKLSNNTN